MFVRSQQTAPFSADLGGTLPFSLLRIIPDPNANHRYTKLKVDTWLICFGLNINLGVKKNT